LPETILRKCHCSYIQKRKFMSAITAGAASALRISRQGALYRLNSRKCNTTLRQPRYL
jgi:hypothetical protein